MKAKIDTTKTIRQSGFPCLMIAPISGRVVLFSSYEEGIQVNETKDRTFHIGHFSKTWAMSDFEYFTGSITLSND